MRVRRLFHAVRSAPRKAHVISGATFVATIGTVVPLLLVSNADASAGAGSTPSVRVATVTLSAPPTVTRGRPLSLSARLSLAGVGVPNRPLQFVARAPGSSFWRQLGSATTGAGGDTSLPTGAIEAATEFGVYYSDVSGVVSSATVTQVVHVIDMKAVASRNVVTNTLLRLSGRLVEDGRQGLAHQRLQVRFRASRAAAWGPASWVTTSSTGVATVTHRALRSFQVGFRFPGASGLAASPLAITTIRVTPRPAISSSGFRFPFLNPWQAESPGSWSLDQGVDMFAQGEACGAAAKLVAVGDGTVIQTGISGFGPTAPVIRMSSGPFKGRNVYYGHTGHIYVHVGEQVHIGQLVAQIGCGQVGYSAAPHLEIGVGEPGGPPCCPPWHATASMMYRQLVAALHS